MKERDVTNAIHGTRKAGDSSLYLLLLFVLGFTTILAQVLILREFLVAFGGNELIIGLFLSSWMVLNAAGAFAGRFFTKRLPHPRRIIAAVYVTGFVPFLLLFLTDFFRNRVFLPGIQPGILQIMAAAVLILSVYCMAAGFLFTRLAVLVRTEKEKKQVIVERNKLPVAAEHVKMPVRSEKEMMPVAAEHEKMVGRAEQESRSLDKSYAAESLGSMAGGIVFSFLLVYLFDNLEAACIAAVVSALAAAYAAKGMIPIAARVAASLSVLVFAVVFIVVDGGQAIRQHLFPGQQIVEIQDTRYGNLTVTRLAEQLNFYQNNILLFSTNDRLAGEEAVHYGLVQHQDPAEVLLISGGIAGLATEILKYGTVRQIDYIELDPKVFVLGSMYTSSLSNDRIIPLPLDARRFVRESRSTYDAVIMNLPEPSTLELNRCFTREFFSDVKDLLPEDGVLTFSLPSTMNYMNEAAVKLHSSIYNTCRTVFRHVYIYPAGRNIFVASDTVLGYRIAHLIEERDIPTEFVNRYYLDDMLTEQRSEELLARLLPGERINTDYRPAALYGSMSYWMSLFQGNMNVFLMVAAVISLAAYAWFLSRHPAYHGMFTAGFTASSLQIILLISFQIVMGHIYQSLGLFIAVFMAGLAAGALARQWLLPVCTYRNYALSQLILVLLCCGIPLFICISENIYGHPLLTHLLFGGMILSVSFMTGILFSASLAMAGDLPWKMAFSGRAARLPGIYATDMAGAALGAILTTLLLIPLVGVLNTSFSCALLVLTSAIVVFIKGKTFRQVSD